MREGLAWHRERQSEMDALGGTSELYVEKPDHSTKATSGYHKVDHYSERKRRVYSMKHAQLADIALETAKGYLREAEAKYSPGTKIASVPSTPVEMRGRRLKGRLFLLVPVQSKSVPTEVLKYAKQLDIMIIDQNGKIYIEHDQ